MHIPKFHRTVKFKSLIYLLGHALCKPCLLIVVTGMILSLDLICLHGVDFSLLVKYTESSRYMTGSTCKLTQLLLSLASVTKYIPDSVCTRHSFTFPRKYIFAKTVNDVSRRILALDVGLDLRPLFSLPLFRRKSISWQTILFSDILNAAKGKFNLITKVLL